MHFFGLILFYLFPHTHITATSKETNCPTNLLYTDYKESLVTCILYVKQNLLHLLIL